MHGQQSDRCKSEFPIPIRVGGGVETWTAVAAHRREPQRWDRGSVHRQLHAR